MTDWLTKLEDLEKEALPGKWSEKNERIVANGYTILGPIHYTFGSASGALICHLRNRSKEIASLVEAVQDLPTEPGWDSGSLHGKILELKELLNKLLKE